MPPELLFFSHGFSLVLASFCRLTEQGWKRATGTVSQAERHRDRVRSGLGKTVTLIQAAARRVCEQIYVRTRWRRSLDTVQQRCKDRIAQALPLVSGQYGHIDDVEVPPAVAEQPAHADDCSRLLVYYVACGPGASQACSALLFRLRGKTCLRAKAQVVLKRRRRHHERVARHHASHSGSSEGGVSITASDGNPGGNQSVAGDDVGEAGRYSDDLLTANRRGIFRDYRLIRHRVRFGGVILVRWQLPGSCCFDVYASTGGVPSQLIIRGLSTRCSGRCLRLWLRPTAMPASRAAWARVPF